MYFPIFLCSSGSRSMSVLLRIFASLGIPGKTDLVRSQKRKQSWAWHVLGLETSLEYQQWEAEAGVSECPPCPTVGDHQMSPWLPGVCEHTPKPKRNIYSKMSVLYLFSLIFILYSTNKLWGGCYRNLSIISPLSTGCHRLREHCGPSGKQVWFYAARFFFFKEKQISLCCLSITGQQNKCV